MFKKFINNAAKSIKSEIKEELGIKDRKELFSEVSIGANEIKDALKKDLNDSKLSANDVAEISDGLFLGGLGIGKEWGNTKFFNKAAGGINKAVSKIEAAIPENELFIGQKEKFKDPVLNNFSNIIENTKQSGMISENLNSLIEYALVDGELTEKEKQVLFKKAEIEGIDLDEFEMILDAKLFKSKQSKAPIQEFIDVSAAPKSDKFGDIKKCPSCGAIVESFSTNCKDCNYDFKNIHANNTIERLFSTLEKIEATRKTGFGSFLGATYGVSIPDTDKRKVEVITSFPVPNTKDDILEFLIHSIPRIRFQQTTMTKGIKYQSKPFTGWNSQSSLDKLNNLYAETWLNKCKEIINKARLLMKDDKKTLGEIENYAEQLGIK